MAEQQKVSGKVFDMELLKRVLALAGPYKMRFVVATILAVSLSLLGPIRPLLIKVAIDDKMMQDDMHGLMMICLLMAGILIMETIFRYSLIYTTNWLGQSVVHDLRRRVYDHITKLKLRFFDQTPIGTATTRTINDVETINQIFSQGLITIIADLMMLVAIIVFMFVINWKLALVSVCTLPLFIYATYLFKESIKKAFQEVRKQVANMNAFLQEHITGMRIVQIFNAEKKEMEKFKAINVKQREANIRAVWSYSIFFPAVEIIQVIAIASMVWLASSMVMKGTLEIGAITAFILYINMMYRPLRWIADRFNTLQMGLVASERVFELLDKDETIADEGKIVMEEIKGQLEFEKVHFAYDDVNYVLKDINFKVEPGETLAIVGSTGSGKSTIINILNRFYEIQQGKISIDKLDIRNIKLDSLRSNISIVLQDVFLFGGSILENITLRNENITRQQAIDAAKLIGAHDFIMRMPGNYDYNVMERGATLSLGQRQLISFVRALVYDPSILILDEATSSVDTESEIIIQNAIERLVKDRTSIVIAHRLSTIRNANKIMVLSNGEIVEFGQHEELLNLNGYYRKLHDMQFKTGMVA